MTFLQVALAQLNETTTKRQIRAKRNGANDTQPLAEVKLRSALLKCLLEAVITAPKTPSEDHLSASSIEFAVEGGNGSF